MASPAVGPHLCQDRKTVYFWHDQIQDDECRNFLGQGGQRRWAIIGYADGVSG